MPNWSTTTKHEPSSINNGRRYELRDRVSIEQLNNMTENSFYAMEASSVAKEKAEEALKFAQGSGTTVYENGSPVAEFNADKKVDKTKLEQDYYTKEEVNDLVENGGAETDLSNYYTKTETESLLIKKADKGELNNYLPTTTKYGASLDLSINTTDYKVTVQLKDQNGNNLGDAKTIDLPLESVVVSGRYDDATKKVVLTLQNNTEISFSVADLVSGLQSQITLSNKLASDLVSDTNQTNKFVTAGEKSYWNSKADKTELESFATKEELNSYAKKDEIVTEDDLKDYATETQLNTGLSNLNNTLIGEINKKADTSELEGLEESINQVSNNLKGVTNKYLSDAVVSSDGKTLAISQNTSTGVKTIYFEGGGANADENLSCIRTEDIYDMANPDKTLGYPNGIPASTGVTINANKYYELKVYYVCYNDSVSNIGSTSNSLTLNLSNSLNDICFADDVGGLLYNGGVNSAYFNVRVQYWKTTQQIALYPFFNGTLQSSGLYYISKIEGILKTPAMIYTGAELYEGNGISIKDGVISASNIKVLWENPNTNIDFHSQTITLKSSDYDFLLVIYAAGKGGEIIYENSVISQKGNAASLTDIAALSSSPFVRVGYRDCVYVSDISYSFGDAVFGLASSSYLTLNSKIIPKIIYGIKVV